MLTIYMSILYKNLTHKIENSLFIQALHIYKQKPWKTKQYMQKHNSTKSYNTEQTTEHDTANWKEKKIHKKLIKLTHSEDTWKV